MGRKSKLVLQENQLLNDSEIIEVLSETNINMTEKERQEFKLSLYQFAKLIFDNQN
jgi:hypothetical protein